MTDARKHGPDGWGPIGSPERTLFAELDERGEFTHLLPTLEWLDDWLVDVLVFPEDLDRLPAGSIIIDNWAVPLVSDMDVELAPGAPGELVETLRAHVEEGGPAKDLVQVMRWYRAGSAEPFPVDKIAFPVVAIVHRSNDD